MMSKYFYTLVILAVFAINCLSADESSIEGGDEVISISVQAVEVAEVFEMLARQGRVNILLGQGVSGKVSLNLYDVTVGKALKSVATAAGFVVEHHDDTYYVFARDDVGKEFTSGLTQIRAFSVQFSDPEQVAEILENHLSRYGKVTALPDRNMLIVEELPDFMERVAGLLEELDKQPHQILIEARILQISLDDTEIYGLDWAKLFDSPEGTTGSIGVQGLASPGLQGFFFSLMNANIQAALNLLSAQGRVTTLATPKLLALEHQQAEVVIGERLGYRVTTTINQVTTESVAFIESGVILKVVPFVSRDGMIMLDIHPEVSNGTVSDGIPSIITTEVTTQLLAHDGETILIGGLMRTSESTRKEGVPILGDIPFIGKLFQNSEKIVFNTETVVLITPRIMKDGMTGVELLPEKTREAVGASDIVGGLNGDAETGDGDADENADNEVPDIDDPYIEETVEEYAEHDSTSNAGVVCETRGPKFAEQRVCRIVDAVFSSALIP